MSDQAEELRRRLEAKGKGGPLPPRAESKPAPAFQPPPVTSSVRALPTTASKNTCICTHCGSVSIPKTVTRGSLGIEIVLWLCWLLPGLIYSIWRLTTKYKACPQCLAASPVPLSTPRGRKLLEEYRQT